MKPLSKKAIEKAVLDKFSVVVELDKTEGFYYWCGDAVAFFDESCTYITRLNDYTLERWVGDFEIKLRKTEAEFESDILTLINTPITNEPIIIKLGTWK
jgi:hypothetical protein